MQLHVNFVFIFSISSSIFVKTGCWSVTYQQKMQVNTCLKTVSSFHKVTNPVKQHESNNIVLMPNDRNSCVKDEKSELERDVQTLAPCQPQREVGVDVRSSVTVT